MKMRRVMLMLEVDTDWPVAKLLKEYRDWPLRRDNNAERMIYVRQAQVNAIRPKPTAKKRKRKRK